ncbi:MAG TPA: CPBP family intramembrane glutamic endopeptidase [Bryobacteraceae bacterium]|nr:CPBP family intramembrane glutamic endopeptidase [Bryobacteraceae bacterium]
MTLRLVELLLLFVIGPAAFARARHRIPAIPALWAAAAYCLAVLFHDPQFNRAHLWDPAVLSRYAAAILELFAVVTLIGIALVFRYSRQTFLSFPKSNPLLWSAIMVLYPVLSVYPQGLIYRAFFFERYRPLFGPSWLLVLASAAAFAWLHIVFRNPLAVALTFPAGLLFALRYLETGSLFVSSFEHALYGCAIFTVGLGRWFYQGTIPRVALPGTSR